MLIDERIIRTYLFNKTDIREWKIMEMVKTMKEMQKRNQYSW